MAQGDLTAVIRALLERRGWNQEDLANRLKTTQATVSRWLAGAEPRGDKRDAIRQLARELGILEDGTTAKNHVVPIMGRVGGGAHIEPDFEQVPTEGVEQVELPYAIAEDLIGFRVIGDSMAPTYEESGVARERRGEGDDWFKGERKSVVRVFLVALLGSSMLSASAGALSREGLVMCSASNRALTDQVLRTYTDAQVKNGLCMASKFALEAVVKSDQSGIELCMQTGRIFMGEFKRRFPTLDPNTVIGRC